jgi:hypothetical protein
MLVAEFSPTKTSPLSDLIPPEIDGLNRKKAIKLLGISSTTCYRYLTCLLTTKPRGFDYISGNQYLSRGTLEALYQFKQLVEKFQYEGAVPRITEHMERFYVLQKSGKD